MNPLAPDIERMNSRLLRLAQESSLGTEVLRQLGASAEVIQTITGANETALRTAERCGVPLVTFTEELGQWIQRVQRERELGTSVVQIPALMEITTFSLHIAQRLALQSDALASLLFGLHSGTAEALARASVSDLESIGRAAPTILRLRCGNEPVIWDRLLIGRLDGKAWTYRVSHETALLSLGSE